MMTEILVKYIQTVKQSDSPAVLATKLLYPDLFVDGGRTGGPWHSSVCSCSMSRIGLTIPWAYETLMMNKISTKCSEKFILGLDLCCLVAHDHTQRFWSIGLSNCRFGMVNSSEVKIVKNCLSESRRWGLNQCPLLGPSLRPPSAQILGPWSWEQRSTRHSNMPAERNFLPSDGWLSACITASLASSHHSAAKRRNKSFRGCMWLEENPLTINDKVHVRIKKLIWYNYNINIYMFSIKTSGFYSRSSPRSQIKKRSSLEGQWNGWKSSCMCGFRSHWNPLT